jgi:ribonuclease T1
MVSSRPVADNDTVSLPTTAYRVVLALLALGLLAGCLVEPQGSRGTLQPTPAVSVPSAGVPSTPVRPTTGVDPDSGLRWVAASALPAEARQTLALITAGGPYPYPRNDDQVFGNREKLLPAKPASYYREYTVETPGEEDRGPRRIVAGRGGERYYTEDHYQSFRRIQEGA